MSVGRNADEKGQGRVGFLVALTILAVGIFLAVKFVPVRIAAYELRDFIEQESRYGAQQDDASVSRRILEKARELDIPLNKKNLQVRRTSSEIIITASYEQPIDLKVTTYRYRFRVEQKSPLF